MSQTERSSPILLSVQRASGTQRRAALAVSLLLLVAFATTLPFATIPGPSTPALFIVQMVWVGINDLITAALLFGQYSIQPARGLNILAGGYLFTALTAIPYALSYPGGFSETGLLPGPLSPPWLFVGWYVALPLAVIAYGLSSDRGGPDARSSIPLTIFAAIVATAVLVLIVTAGYDWLPPVRGTDGNYTLIIQIILDAWAALALVALLVLSRRRPYSVLDTWLMVAALAWLCAMMIGGGVLPTHRYDIGNDVSRAFYVLASTFVLLVLLSEMTALYARVFRDRERRLKEMQAVLVHLSRVNELGQNVSSLIHEVNQPLSAICNYLGAVIHLIETSNAERLKPILERAAEQAIRATDIVRHLRDFIANRESDKRTDDVTGVLRDAVRLALVGITAEAPAIEMRCAPNASTAFFDRVQVEQVVFNLVRNAIEAMANAARRVLAITAAPTADNNMVEIRIADTGPGLPPAVRERLFEPFVTSKPTGLGIGLSICRVIIEEHGGQLEAYDNPGGGTVFRFTLLRGPFPDRPDRV